MKTIEQKGMYPDFPRSGKPGSRITHYCPGCGHGIVNKLVAEVCAELGLQDAVRTADLLLFTQLDAVLGLLPAALSMHSRRGMALGDGALF